MTSILLLSTSHLPSLPPIRFPGKSKPFPPVTISCHVPNEPKDLIRRPTAGFHPTLWGDRFANYVAEPKVLAGDKQEDDASKHKESIRRGLTATTGNPWKTMKFIADIQRLAVGYHFEKEIEEALTRIYETYHDDHNEVDGNLDDLYHVSLRFRLLRQEGFDISYGRTYKMGQREYETDIFNKFKDENGELNESLAEDIHGMLGLYEAAHMGKHGEDILDEAIVFTTSHLRDAIGRNPGLQANPVLLYQVKQALLCPIRKNIGRLDAIYYVSVYNQIDSYDKQLLEFAKTDFNMVQSLHKEELSDLTKWWNDLNLVARLPFGRDRLVEAYLWMVGIYSEPRYSSGRKIMTKVNKVMTYIDDAYDSYGTFEELELFTDAFQRWDMNCKYQLPEYMQIIYETTLDVFVEIEEEMIKQGKPYFHYAKEALKNVTKAYFQEAKWRQEAYVPTMEAYVSNGVVTSLYYPLSMIIIASLVDEDVASKEIVEWLFETPRALRAISIMIRCRNDVCTRKKERETRGEDVVTSVECYMKEYGVCEEEAYEGINNLLSSEWKHLNRECLELGSIVASKDLLKILVNIAAVNEVTNLEGDGYTRNTKEMIARIASLFIDPIPV